DEDVATWFALDARHDPHDQSNLTAAELRAVMGGRDHAEDLWFTAHDGSVGGSISTISAEDGQGGTMLGVFISDDPGEPTLGDVVDLAVARARAGNAPRVHTYLELPSHVVEPFTHRHGFVVHEHWFRFGLDLSGLPDTLPEPLGGHAFTTLVERPDLAADAHRTYTESFADMPGDFPRPERGLDRWLKALDVPPGGRDHLLLLEHAGSVAGFVHVKRGGAASGLGYVGLLGVRRDARGNGLAHLLKRAVGPFARTLGLDRLESTTHEANTSTIRLNRAAGWLERDSHVVLEKRLD
ncbi:MAG: hypothetical protein JWN72_2578, partial [Thermoleophilia bacterium]|nr:hypothetical protein [Thermoleophilia bacterium]